MAWDVVLCVVCRVWAVIWLKCVRNVIWDHLIYFIHWQPIWPECDPAISTGAPRSLPASDWSGVVLLPSDWLAGFTRSLTYWRLSLHAPWAGSSIVQLCMTQAMSGSQHKLGGECQRSPPLTFLSWDCLSVCVKNCKYQNHQMAHTSSQKWSKYLKWWNKCVQNLKF